MTSGISQEKIRAPRGVTEALNPQMNFLFVTPRPCITSSSTIGMMSEIQEPSLRLKLGPPELEVPSSHLWLYSLEA